MAVGDAERSVYVFRGACGVHDHRHFRRHIQPQGVLAFAPGSRARDAVHVADDPGGGNAFCDSVRVPSGAGPDEQEAGETVLPGKEEILSRVVLLGQTGKQTVRIGGMHLARCVSDNRTETARMI